MRRVLITTMMSLLIGGSVLPASAMDMDPQEPGASTTAVPDGDATAPAVTAPGHDEADSKPPQDQTDSKNGMMQNFTRHRPGACPEGPPCHVVDED